MIFIELAFVEMSREAVRRLGLRFGDSIDFETHLDLRVLQDRRSPARVEGFNPIGSFLDMALQAGHARMHFKQSLVTEAGVEAHFRSGGEYSFKTSTRYSSGMAKIPFGIEMRITPDLLAANQIRVSLESSIREPDLSSGIGDYPAMSEKELQTHLLTRSGETLALAGLLKNSQGRSTQAVPGFSEIPILGRFFESKSFQRNLSQAYIFITTRVLSDPWKPASNRSFRP